MVLMMIGKL